MTTATPAAATDTAAAQDESACTAAASAREGAVLSVPFRVVDGRIYVDAKVNGQGPFVFAVDTGAGGVGRADVSLVGRLQLPIAGSGRTSDGVSAAEVKTVRLAAIELGGYFHLDVEVVTRDYSGKMSGEAPFSGILGREFFADGLLVIDYPSKRLIFTRAVALRPGQRDVLPYDRAFRVPVRIGDVLTEGNLDTGANVSFVMPKALFDRLGGSAIRPAGDARLTNTVIQTGTAAVRGPLRIGAATLADIDVRVSEQYRELLVGAHVLQRYVVLIDQRSKQVAICP